MKGRRAHSLAGARDIGGIDSGVEAGEREPARISGNARYRESR